HAHLHSIPTRRSSDLQKRITTIVANDAPVRFGKGLTTQQLFCWNASKTMSVVDLQNTAMRWGDNSYKLPKHSGNSAPGPRGDRRDRKSTRLNCSHVAI